MYQPWPSLPSHAANAANATRKKLASCAISLLWLSIAAPSSAASFPCEKAGNPVERSICKDNELSSLDESLGRYYGAARAGLRRAAECLSSDQKAWLRDVRGACKDTDCLKSAYLQRLGELDGLQPSATALKTLRLPKVPTLVAILPPAEDEVAAPRSSQLKRQSVRGKLVNEVATGDGYVIVEQDGSKYLLAGLMFLDDSTSVLDALSKESATAYLVRGNAQRGAHGEQAFSQGACRYVYRMPQ